MDIALQLALNSAIGGSVNAVLGAALALVYAASRVLHLAHGAVVLAAGYVAYDLSQRGVPFALAALGGTLAAIGLGVLAEVVVYAPLRRRRAGALALLLASLALLTIGTNVLLLRYSAATVRPELPFLNTSLHIVGGAITPLQVLLIALAAALLFGLGAVLRWTRLGQALRAVADHPEVAAVVGIPVERMRIAAIAVASAIGGATGALLALELNLTPELATLYAVKGFAAAIIGGAGSIPGAVVAGILLGTFQQVGSYLIGGGWQDALVYGLVFVFLIVRPQGLFGRT